MVSRHSLFAVYTGAGANDQSIANTNSLLLLGPNVWTACLLGLDFLGASRRSICARYGGHPSMVYQAVISN